MGPQEDSGTLVVLVVALNYFWLSNSIWVMGLVFRLNLVSLLFIASVFLLYRNLCCLWCLVLLV